MSDPSRSKRTYVCFHCGSDCVQHQTWVDPNTDEALDLVVADDAVWCAACEKHAGELAVVEAEVHGPIYRPYCWTVDDLRRANEGSGG